MYLYYIYIYYIKTHTTFVSSLAQIFFPFCLELMLIQSATLTRNPVKSMEYEIPYLTTRRTRVLALGLELALLIVILAGSLELANTTSSDLGCADCALLSSIEFQGRLVYAGNVHAEETAARDFGGMKFVEPRAVLYPASVEDITRLIKAIYEGGPSTNLTVAAKGHAHSTQGQAQAKDGVVIQMSALRGISVQIKGSIPSSSSPNWVLHGSEVAYVDVRGGELWIDVLQATLKHGLAPKSWTDYLYLSVGGTLSNAGISGQAFLHGPQISNVYQLEVVTGKGDLVDCSPYENSDLFYAALGGLGQFGIITRARIALEPAPQMVKWIRAVYSEWDSFMRDQEYLISQPQGRTFDYLEGFVVANTGNLIDNWRSGLFKPQNKLFQDKGSQWKTGMDDLYYVLEVTLNYNEAQADAVDERTANLLAPLRCLASSVYSTDIPYVEFLDRVHTGELKLREKGLWDIPHPWLNLFVPRRKVAEFNAGVLKQILPNKGSGRGPIIIYPMNRNKWDSRTSAVIPDEDLFYLVAILRSASTEPGEPTTRDLIDQNEAILKFCKQAGIAEKQYLPSFSEARDWKRQFGSHKWKIFLQRKARYDPSALLSPGQNIFRRGPVQGNYSLIKSVHSNFRE